MFLVYYIAFCVIAVLLLAGLSLWLHRIYGEQTPLPLWIVLAVLLVGAYIAGRAAGRQQHGQMTEAVSGLGATFADELQREGYLRLGLETPPDDPVYLKLIETLKRWQTLNTYVADIYTVAHDGAGRSIYILDAETDYDHDGLYTGERESRTPIGEQVDPPDPMIEKTFATGHFESDEIARGDRWGTWISFYTPIRDSTGHVRAVLGIDYNPDRWDYPILFAELTVLGLFGSVILIVFFVYAAFIARTAMIRNREAGENERRLNAFFDAMPYDCWSMDRDGRYNMDNRASKASWGERAVGLKIEERENIPAELLAVWAENNRRAFAGELVEHDFSFQRNGKLRHFHGVIAPVRNGDEIIGIAGMNVDITDRVELGERLRHSQRLESVGQLAGGLAHEFNNFFTPILLHLDMLEEDLEGRPDHDRHTRPIREAVNHAIELSRRLLSLGRKTEHEEPAWLELNPIVKSTSALLRSSLGRDIRVNLSLQRDLPRLPLLSTATTQIVVNLLVNGRDAIKSVSPPVEKPEITVFTSLVNRPRGAAQCLTVIDNGCGMDEATRQRIFEPFFTTKEPGRGTGLGLALVWNAVDTLNGWIEVDSTPGKGTTFRVFFPSPPPPGLPTTEAIPEEESPPPAIPRAGRRILIVDDDPLVSKALAERLRREGLAITLASDGSAAFHLAKQAGQFDLIVTDFNMPQLNGLDLLDALAGLGLRVPVIVISGHLAPGLEEKLRAAGAAAVMAKPLRAEELLAQMNTLLDR